MLRQIGLAAHFHEARRRAIEKAGTKAGSVQAVRFSLGRRNQADPIIIERIDEIDETAGQIAAIGPRTGMPSRMTV